MRTHLFLLLLCCLFAASCAAQCLSGDCKNGQGKMDMGYAVYEGGFKDGQPHGTGTMDYGGGDKYTGGWYKGREDGSGKLYKKGVASDVFYSIGVLQVAPREAVVIGGNGDDLEKIQGCTTGDCRNGYGEITFPSGSRYAGGFKWGKLHGAGTFTFTDGDVIKATFVEDAPISGTHYHSGIQTLFTGTFNRDGSPKDGTYTSTRFDGIVAVVDGKVTAERHPEREKAAAAQAEHDRMWKVCPACNGKGGEAVADYYNTSTKRELWGSRAVGQITYEVETKRNYTGTTHAVPCLKCNGKGEIKR